MPAIEPLVPAPLPPPSFGRRILIYFHESMRVLAACIAPAAIAIGCAVLMWAADPAHDMLAQMALEFVDDEATRWRLAIFIVCLIAHAACCWYWSRATLMFRQALPPIYSPTDNDPKLLAEADFYAKARPRVVEWLPRLIGVTPFVGWAAGLCSASLSFRQVSSVDATNLNYWSLLPTTLGALFLYILWQRRALLRKRTGQASPGQPMPTDPWAMNGAIDPRAELLGIRDLISRRRFEDAKWRGVSYPALALSLVVTLVFALLAPIAPVTLGDGLRGLAVPIVGASVLVPWFSLLLITGRAKRWPLAASAFLLMILLPPINGLISRHLEVRVDNHDVRSLASSQGAPADRPSVADVLRQWADQQVPLGAEYSDDCVRALGGAAAAACREPAIVENCRRRPNCALIRERPPFIVVAGEGGASRAGYWVALSLGEMIRRDPKARESIFAVSAVSGGALGAALVRALIDVDRVQEKKFGMTDGQRVVCRSASDAPGTTPVPYASCIRLFMDRDFLASAFVGMFFTDIEQRFLPASLVALPDRAETIERAWEASWDELVDSISFDGADAAAKARIDQFKSEFRGLFARGIVAAWGKLPDETSLRHGVVKPWPVVLLNGTVVESGRRAITSNVRFRNESIAADKLQASTKPETPCSLRVELRLQGKKKPGDCLIWDDSLVEDPLAVLNRDIRISTAVNMSARFPVVQPAGGIRKNGRGGRVLHVVDGGVYENFGAATIHDVLSFVMAEDGAWAPRNSEHNLTGGVRPLVVLISTDHDLDGVRQFAPAYGGQEDVRNAPMVERKMILGCNLKLASSPQAPVCERKPFEGANEILGVPVALYQSRSGRGEQAIHSIRERLQWGGFFDKNFFHFRQCIIAGRRPASMTWFVSSISRKAMDDMLPSVDGNLPKPVRQYGVAEWRERASAGTPPQSFDPCQNHDELKRLIDRIDGIRLSER